MEKRNNTPGVLFQRIQCGSEAGLQILLVFHRLLSDTVVLDLVPNLFVRVVFGCPLRQEEHPQLAPVRPHIVTHLAWNGGRWHGRPAQSGGVSCPQSIRPETRYTAPR